MGNPQSKAAKQMASSDVPYYETSYTCQAPYLAHNEIVSTEVVADQIEGTNVVQNYPSSPERLILGQTEQHVLPQPTDGDIINVQWPSHLISGEY